MKFGRRTLDKLKPHLWFAWYPVTLLDGRWVWLEYVRRRRVEDDFSVKYEVDE